MNRRLIRILGGKTEHYPYALESHYPRILETILMLWDKEEIDSYFMELMVNDRADRSGFPEPVAREIMQLSLLHAADSSPDPNTASEFQFCSTRSSGNWIEPDVHLQTELCKLGFSCTPAGLFEAVESGKRAAVILFIAAQNHTEFRDNRGWTPLMIAAFYGQDENIHVLLERNADVNATDTEGNSALHLAALQGHTACTATLIDSHARLNTRNYEGCTPLILASTHNHHQIIKQLIAGGADLDAVANNGDTALGNSLQNDNSETVQILLDAGAQTTRNG
jgi:hypothetical protein